MSSHTSLILLIVVLTVTVGGIFIFTEQTRDFAHTPREQAKGTLAEIKSDELTIVNVVGQDVTNNQISTVRIQVKYEGDGEIPLEDAFIQLRTDKSIADLNYRNGTLEKDYDDGFYTQ